MKNPPESTDLCLIDRCFIKIVTRLLVGVSLSEPHCYVANRGKRNALWCVRTRNFSTVIKVPSACDRNFYQFANNLPIVFPSSQLLRQFAWLRISQDVICWQSWSNNNSKYGLVRRTYTVYNSRTRCFRASWPICFCMRIVAAILL